MTLQTFASFKKLCDFLVSSNTYVFLTCSEKIKCSDKKKVVYLKHDVECNPKNALKIAKIEAAFGIRATFYFQVDLVEKNPSTVIDIANLGHEIGYHYDVLDECNGNFESAKNAFNKALKVFEDVSINIKTVCPHGNPVLERSNWTSNKDFFRDHDVAKAYTDITDIIVNPQDAFEGPITYISDTGYFWKVISNVSFDDRITTVDTPLDIMADFQEISTPNIVISSHPHRWVTNDVIAVYLRYRFLLLKFIFKKMRKNRIILRILKPFYHLARRF